MAKRLSTKGTNVHKYCKYCKEVENEFLSIRGIPILGRCEYMEKYFILNEKTDCKRYIANNVME